MGKTTIVKGDTFFITGGNFKVHSQENIENYSQKQVIQKGAEKGVTHNKPKTAKLTDLKVPAPAPAPARIPSRGSTI